MRTKIVQLLLVMLALMCLQSAFAKKHKHLKGTEIVSVDVVEKKIVMKVENSGQTLAYQLPVGTTITVNEQPAPLTEIKPGMTVVSYTEADEHVLSQIDVESKKTK